MKSNYNNQFNSHLKIISAIIFFLCINYQSGYSQNDSSISFIAYWSKGDFKSYKLTKSEIRLKNDSITKNTKTEQNFKLTVMDSTKNSYILKAIYENTMLNEMQIPTDYESVINKFKNIEIVYKTDELGSFQEVINLKEVSEMMRDFFRILPQVTGDTSKEFVDFMSPFIQMYTTREGIESLILPEIQIFHFPMGSKFNYYDTLRYEEAIPNLLGGKPIKGNGNIYFNSIDSINGKCTFTNTVLLDSTDSKNTVVDMLNSFISRSNFKSKAERENAIEKMKFEFSNYKMDIVTNSQFSYYYYPGWPINIQFKRTAKIQSSAGQITRIDELNIEEIKSK